MVRAALDAPRADRVIVVDDHSTDDTVGVATRAGAEVVTSAGRASKALALATGVRASTAEVIVFFDADIIDARPAHFESIAAPVLDDDFAMCCGLVDYGAARNRLFVHLPPITGLRAVRRDVFEAIAPSRLRGFQIEIMINEVIARGGMRSAIRVLPQTRHRSKVRKMGVTRGAFAHLSMTLELLHCLTFVPLWTYRSYLRNLTVLTTEPPRRS